MRTIAAFAVSALLLSSAAASPATADILCGDLNDSGSVNTSDALLALKRAVGQNVGMTCGPPGEPVRTGQWSIYGPGSDGDLQEGSVRSFTDNGDGTITDYATGLMWEKKDDLGGIHDKDATYSWAAGGNTMNGSLATVFLANLNAGGGFAGHTDWRIPNRFELETLFNLQVSSPSTHNAFHYNCTAGCSISNCSCTNVMFYWSSTTSALNSAEAWAVGFGNSTTTTGSKVSAIFARAVRNAANRTTTPLCQAPEPPQCLYNDPCSNGVCSLSREACSYQSDCPLAPDEQCCCLGYCI